MDLLPIGTKFSIHIVYFLIIGDSTIDASLKIKQTNSNSAAFIELTPDIVMPSRLAVNFHFKTK